MLRAVVIGTGAYLPKRVMPNSEFESFLDTSDEWIAERTGIKQRHIAEKGELTSDLAANAAKDALTTAKLSANDIDFLIVATTTPDDTLPSTATKVQHKIGMTRGAAFDVSAACSGFVYAASIADAYIKSGMAKRVMVIGAETYSRIVDWKDRGTCILFGDGAAAVIFEAQEQPGQNTDRGVLAVCIESDGQYAPLLTTNGGVSSTQSAGILLMSGKEVYKLAVQKMPEAVLKNMETLGLPLSAIDWVVPHQANMRILAGVGDKLGIAPERLVATVSMHANTSAASIPLALHAAVLDGRIKEGQLIACPALGAGLTWGALTVRW